MGSACGARRRVCACVWCVWRGKIVMKRGRGRALRSVVEEVERERKLASSFPSPPPRFPLLFSSLRTVSSKQIKYRVSNISSDDGKNVVLGGRNEGIKNEVFFLFCCSCCLFEKGMAEKGARGPSRGAPPLLSLSQDRERERKEEARSAEGPRLKTFVFAE